MRTKLRLYKTLASPVLLYGCEISKVKKNNEKAVAVLHSKCLHRIVRVRWQNHISTEDIDLLERAEMKPLGEEIKTRRWKLVGHILRHDRGSDGRISMTWTSEGRRRRERSKTIWRRTAEKERRYSGWGSWDEVLGAAVNRKK